MTTPNLIRRQKIDTMVQAFRKMQTVGQEAIDLADKLRLIREEKQRQALIQAGKE